MFIHVCIIVLRVRHLFVDSFITKFCGGVDVGIHCAGYAGQAHVSPEKVLFSVGALGFRSWSFFHCVLYCFMKCIVYDLQYVFKSVTQKVVEIFGG